MTMLTETELDANIEFNKIKTIFENPRYYLSNFFTDLKTQIDTRFVQKELITTNNELTKAKINSNWIQMINKITEFETECFKNHKTNKFNKDFDLKLTNQLNQIETKLNSTNYNKDYLLDEIHAIKFCLEKLIFSNRSILFLDKSKLKDNYLLAKLEACCTIGKLIILNDYINTHEFIRLLDHNPFQITNTQLKFERLIQLINHDLESQINEINLDITLIDLDSKKIENLTPNLFSGFNQLKTLYLSNNKIEYLDENIFNRLFSLEIIWLGKNYVKQLSSNTFNGLKNLKRINLWQNELKELKEKTFKDLINLELIDLHSNQIETCDVDSFNGLINLKEINLSNNKLKTIQSNLFSNLINLEMLNLSNNEIEFLDENQFVELTRLTHLILRNNKLKRIECKLFKGLKSLIEINLASNQLEYLTCDLFHELTKLKSIELQNNLLDDLNMNLFHGLISLKFIDVSNNKLNKLFSLCGLKEMRELHAMGNRLESIDKKQFCGLVNLRVINMSMNNLKSLDKSVFKNLNELREINLKQNNQLNANDLRVKFNDLPILI